MLGSGEDELNVVRGDKSFTKSAPAGSNLDRHDYSENPASFYRVSFVVIHLGCFAVFWTGMRSDAVALGFALYFIRIFAIGAGRRRIRRSKCRHGAIVPLLLR
jgi:hypothetical protein